MIRVSVLYPYTEGARFDHNYYATKHMAIVRNGMGDTVRKIEVDKGLGSGQPGQPAPFAAVGHLFFDSMEAFQAAFAAGGVAAMSDVPNFTDIQPQVLVSETEEA